MPGFRIYTPVARVLEKQTRRGQATLRRRKSLLERLSDVKTPLKIQREQRDDDELDVVTSSYF